MRALRSGKEGERGRGEGYGAINAGAQRGAASKQGEKRKQQWQQVRLINAAAECGLTLPLSLSLSMDEHHLFVSSKLALLNRRKGLELASFDDSYIITAVGVICILIYMYMG